MNPLRIAILALALFTTATIAAPRTQDVCEGLDSAACLEQMSALMAQESEAQAAPPKRGVVRRTTARADGSGPRLNLDKSLSAEGTE